MSTKGLLALKSSCYYMYVLFIEIQLPDQYIWRWELALQLLVDTHLTLELRNSHSDLFIEEDRVNAVTGDTVWFEQKNLKNSFHFSGIGWSGFIFAIVLAHMYIYVVIELCQMTE